VAQFVFQKIDTCQALLSSKLCSRGATSEKTQPMSAGPKRQPDRYFGARPVKKAQKALHYRLERAQAHDLLALFNLYMFSAKEGCRGPRTVEA